MAPKATPPDRVRSALFNAAVLIDNGQSVDEALSIIRDAHQLSDAELDAAKSLLPDEVRRV